MPDRQLYTYATAATALSVSAKQVQRYTTAKWCAENGMPLLRKGTLNGRPVIAGDDLQAWLDVAVKREAS